MREVTSKELKKLIEEEMTFISEVPNKTKQPAVLNEAFALLPWVLPMLLPVVGERAAMSMSDYPELEEGLNAMTPQLNAVTNDLSRELAIMTVVMDGIDQAGRYGDTSQNIQMADVFQEALASSFSEVANNTLSAELLNELIKEEHRKVIDDIGSGKIILNEIGPAGVLAAMGGWKMIGMAAAAGAAAFGATRVGTMGIEDRMDRTLKQSQAFLDSLDGIAGRLATTNGRVKEYIGARSYDEIVSRITFSDDLALDSDLVAESKDIGISELTQMIMAEWSTLNEAIPNIADRVGVAFTTSRGTNPAFAWLQTGVSQTNQAIAVKMINGVAQPDSARAFTPQQIANSRRYVPGTGKHVVTTPTPANLRLYQTTAGWKPNTPIRFAPTTSAGTPAGTPPGTAASPGAAPPRGTPTPTTQTAGMSGFASKTRTVAQGTGAVIPASGNPAPSGMGTSTAGMRPSHGGYPSSPNVQAPSTSAATTNPAGAVRGTVRTGPGRTGGPAPSTTQTSPRGGLRGRLDALKQRLPGFAKATAPAAVASPSGGGGALQAGSKLGRFGGPASIVLAGVFAYWVSPDDNDAEAAVRQAEGEAQDLIQLQQRDCATYEREFQAYKSSGSGKTALANAMKSTVGI